MSTLEPSSRARYSGWLLLILLAAAFMRLHNITNIPPGLTHDEADHGITAWSIVSEGVRDIYFTIGYGREPLYDYATALMMTFLGPTFLAGRITAVFASLILIAGMSAWVRRAFDERTALLTAAGLAVGFWPVMAGRQALRSIMLPALFVLVVAVFWRGMELLLAESSSSTTRGLRPRFLFPIAGLLLGLTFYAYIPARALWVIFPALLFYLYLVKRSLFRHLWWRTAVMLLVMLLLALPLLFYLEINPLAEVRIQQLAAPLVATTGGDFEPLWENVQSSMRLFTIQGDMTWRYNVAGRPFLGPLMGILFLAGVLLAVYYTFSRRKDIRFGAASFLALAWLIVGFLPVLLTGPDLSMTQAIGIQPVLYLFPALALVTIGRISIGKRQIADSRWATVFLFLLFFGTAVITYRDYFITWANNPDVRVQYETTMVTAIDYLNTHGDGVASVSSVTPGRYHSPALAQMLLHNEEVDLRWFDARSSLLLPQMETGQYLIPGFTPMPQALEDYFSTAVLEETIPMRDSDLDRPLYIYSLNSAEVSADWQNRLVATEVQFTGILKLLGYDLQTPELEAGGEVQVVTLWQVQKPLEDAVLFAHLLDASGTPIAQADQIGVPGYAWQPGDQFLQLHQFKTPLQTSPGSYPLAFGIYSRSDGQRVPITGGGQGGDLYIADTLVVSP